MDRQTQYAKVKVLHFGKETVGYLVNLVDRVATVSIHGELFQFSSYTLRPPKGIRYTKPCAAGCGKMAYAYTPSEIFQMIFCSFECQYDSRRIFRDEELMEAIIRYKQENDGISPRICQLGVILGASTTTIGEGLSRLRDSGKIEIVGKVPYQNIVVPGGRWIYEGEKI